MRPRILSTKQLKKMENKLKNSTLVRVCEQIMAANMAEYGDERIARQESAGTSGTLSLETLIGRKSWKSTVLNASVSVRCVES